MAHFLFIYRGKADAMSAMTPEEMQQSMNRWETWIREAMQKGWMLNAGDALAPVGCVVKPKHIVTDGPFLESKEVVGGYSVVVADTIGAAAELAKGCPALSENGTVEVRPCLGLSVNP